MRRDLHDRRLHTWQLLVLDGVSEPETVDRIADQYEVNQTTVRDDIAQMGEWLPELDVLAETGASSRCQELRANRQRLHEMALEADDQDDLELELAIRREIRRELNLAQSLNEDVASAEEEEEVEMDPSEVYIAALEQGMEDNDDRSEGDG